MRLSFSASAVSHSLWNLVCGVHPWVASSSSSLLHLVLFFCFYSAVPKTLPSYPPGFLIIHWGQSKCGQGSRSPLVQGKDGWTPHFRKQTADMHSSWRENGQTAESGSLGVLVWFAFWFKWKLGQSKRVCADGKSLIQEGVRGCLRAWTAPCLSHWPQSLPLGRCYPQCSSLQLEKGVTILHLGTPKHPSSQPGASGTHTLADSCTRRK